MAASETGRWWGACLSALRFKALKGWEAGNLEEQGVEEAEAEQHVVPALARGGRGMKEIKEIINIVA